MKFKKYLSVNILWLWLIFSYYLCIQGAFCSEKPTYHTVRDLPENLILLWKQFPDIVETSKIIERDYYFANVYHDFLWTGSIISKQLPYSIGFTFNNTFAIITKQDNFYPVVPFKKTYSDYPDITEDTIRAKSLNIKDEILKIWKFSVSPPAITKIHLEHGDCWNVVFNRLEDNLYPYFGDGLFMVMEPSGKLFSLKVRYCKPRPSKLEVKLSKQEASYIGEPHAIRCLQYMFPDFEPKFYVESAELIIISPAYHFSPSGTDIVTRNQEDVSLFWQVVFTLKERIYINKSENSYFDTKKIIIYLDPETGDFICWDTVSSL